MAVDVQSNWIYALRCAYCRSSENRPLNISAKKMFGVKSNALEKPALASILMRLMMWSSITHHASYSEPILDLWRPVYVCLNILIAEI